MNEIVFSWINGINWNRHLLGMWDVTLRLIASVIICLVIGKIAGKILTRIIDRSAGSALLPFSGSLIHKGAVKRFTMMFPFLLLYFSSGAVFADDKSFLSFWNKFLLSVITALAIYAISAFLDAVEHYYHNFEVSKKNPIKGYIQLLKIFIASIGIITITAALFDRSPWGIITGFGAMTALIIVIFRDWILGLVASIQINANNLVVIGDSIEIEKYGVSGEVIDISLSTIKVKNWDNTISMIPAYSLISETFKNWHGIKEFGGRRIRRILYIDISSITIPDRKILKNISSIRLMKDTPEVRNLLLSVKGSRSSQIDAGSITNIGFFRKYIELYLSNHERISSEQKLMSRLLEPTVTGLPLQVYVYTDITESAEYEKTIADIFEHLISVIPEFGLKLFQNPSGSDVR